MKASTAPVALRPARNWYLHTPNIKPGFDLIGIDMVVENVPVEAFIHANANQPVVVWRGRDRLPILYNFLHATGESEPGWQLDAINDDESLRLFQTATFIVRSSDHADILEVMEGVSDEFVAHIRNSLSTITKPKDFCLRFANAGCRIILAPRLTDAFPFLKDQHPRGWPAELTWDAADGVYENQTMYTVVLAEKYLHSDGLFYKARSWDDPGVVIHELGHALDQYWDILSGKSKVIKSFCLASEIPDFRQSYEKEALAIEAGEDRQALSYFLQESAGCSETWAELTSLVNGHVIYSADKPLLEKYFPKTIECLENLLAKL